MAQTPVPARQAAQFDPSDVYFQGYLLSRAAEKLEADGEYSEAMLKLQQATKMFESVRRSYPDWKPDMVAGRTSKTGEAINQIRPKAEEQQKKNQGAIAELEGGVKNSAKEADPLSPRSVLEVDPLVARRLAEAESEVRRLQKLATDSRAENSESSRNASRVKDIERQRDAMQAQLRAAENDVQSLRARLAESPMENDLKTLNGRIKNLEQEREAMEMALTQSRGAHMDGMARIATLEADLRVMTQKAAELRQKETDMDRNLKAERKVANDVVAGQRRQIQVLEQQLDAKASQLGQAMQRISGLEKELQESQDSFNELKGERDSLLQERDQMSALLKLNESGRIQQLIEQNMGLAKTLREANEKVERLNQEGNTSKDDITDALRDLAIAKSQINKLHQEKREQDQRLVELEKRLKGEENALVKGTASADPAEAEVLKDIIRRQIRVQERRNQARDLLVEAVKQLGGKDERLAQAVELFQGEEVQLTPEEQRLLADRQVDGEFVSPFARDRTLVGRATASLNGEMESYDRAATKAFVAGRLLPTRELYQMIVDANPGNTSALCKLGVVHLRLEDPVAAVDTFRRAVELDENNAYARRMLGFAFMHSGDMKAAEENVRRSVEMAPDDAKSQVLLATLSYRLGRTREAESHLKAAISADPVPSEPYFNLALLCSRDKRLPEARQYYQQSLERGAVPDPALAKRLESQP